MKKYIKLLVVVMLIAGLALCSGCGEKKAEKTVLTLATSADFPPYEFYDGDNIVGIDAEIAALIAEKLGMTLQIEDMDFDSVVPSVQTGKYDIGMAGLSITDDRKEIVNFTNTYAGGKQAILVNKDSKVKGAADVTGGDFKVGVQLGTTGDTMVSWDIEPERYNKYSDAVIALKNGKIDCVVLDNEPAKKFAAANEGMLVLDEAFADEYYAIIYSKDNADFGKKVDAALQALIDDGTVAKIIAKYISEE